MYLQETFQPAKALELGPSGWSLGGSRDRLDTLDMSGHVREPHGRLPALPEVSLETPLLRTRLAIATQCRQIDFLGFVQHTVQALAADAQGLGRALYVAAGCAQGRERDHSSFEGVFERRRTLPERAMASQRDLDRVGAARRNGTMRGAYRDTQGRLLHPAVVDAPSVQPVSALTARCRGRRSCGIEFGW